MGDMSSIISGVGTASTWFFGLFKDMIDMIVANNLLLWSVLLAIVCGSVGLGIKVYSQVRSQGQTLTAGRLAARFARAAACC